MSLAVQPAGVMERFLASSKSSGGRGQTTRATDRGSPRFISRGSQVQVTLDVVVVQLGALAAHLEADALRDTRLPESTCQGFGPAGMAFRIFQSLDE
jgi:hypothetical protein